MSNSNESIKKFGKLREVVGLKNSSQKNKIIEVELDFFKHHRKAKSPQKRGETSFSKFYFKYTSKLLHILSQMDVEKVEELVEDILLARKNNKQIFIFGNGGSASTASHMANDFSKPRFDDDKTLFRVICLNDNISTLTATANDFGYDNVFSVQLKNLMQKDDLIIAISSSGNSKNVINAIEVAKKKGAKTYGVVGFDGGKLMRAAEKTLYIPTKVGQYGYMEDVTLIINHIMSVYVYERDKSLNEGS